MAHQDLSATGVVVTWDDVICADRGGKLDSYEVIVREVTEDAEVYRADVQDTMITVSNLLPYKQYVVQVAYVNAVDRGPQSDYNIRTLQSSELK